MNKSEVFFLNEENISHDVVTIFSPRSQGKIVSDTWGLECILEQIFREHDPNFTGEESLKIK